MLLSKDVEFKGLKELNHVLDQLPIKIQKKVIGNAVRSGSRMLAKAARSNAKEISDFLSNEILVKKSKKESKAGDYVVHIGPSTRLYYEPRRKIMKPIDAIGRWWEFGFVATGPKRTGKGRGITWAEFRGRARKGGTHVPGKRWLTKAFNSAYKSAMEKFKDATAKGIEREAKKLSGIV